MQAPQGVQSTGTNLPCGLSVFIHRLEPPRVPGRAASRPVLAPFVFSGGPGGKATPVPIPNTEVKGLFGEGTAGVARGRVARRRDFFRGRRSTDLRPLFRLAALPRLDFRLGFMR